MEQLISLQLSNDVFSRTYQQKGKDVLCVSTLQDFFEFPENTKTIFVTLSTTKTPDSYAVRVYPGQAPVLQIHHDGDWYIEVTFNKAKQFHSDFMEAAGVAVVYVSLEY